MRHSADLSFDVDMVERSSADFVAIVFRFDGFGGLPLSLLKRSSACMVEAFSAFMVEAVFRFHGCSGPPLLWFQRSSACMVASLFPVHG